MRSSWLVLSIVVGCGGAAATRQESPPPSAPTPSAIPTVETRVAPPPTASTSAAAAAVESCEGLAACKVACDAGAQVACRRAGLAALHDAPEVAAAHFARSCPSVGTGDPEGCHLLGVLLVDGRGIAADVPRALQLWADTCERGHAHSCYTLAIEYKVGAHLPPDGAKVLALYIRSCELGELGGCSAAAQVLDEGTAGVPADEARARALLQKCCDAGRKFECGRLMDMDDRVTPRERAVYRAFHVSHRDAKLDKVDRSPEEAKRLAAAAVAALGTGTPFDTVADKYGGADTLARVGRGERVSFRLKPQTQTPPPPYTSPRPQPEFGVKAGKAIALPNPTFGFVVLYRVR